MSVTVNHTRETKLYGEEVRERWKATFDDGWSFDLRVLPPRGSKALFVLSDVPVSGVPAEVLDKIDEQLAEAGDPER